MIELSGTDKEYLSARIEKGELILVLGAGCVRGCENAKGLPLKTGAELAEMISTNAGYTYQGEDLPTVLDAVQLPTAQLNSILDTEFKGCSPSEELKNAFRVPWWRVYTFNIDDAIENIQGVLSK